LNESIITNISLHIAKDDIVTTTVSKKPNKSPSFYKVGKGTKNMKGITSIDLLAEIANMTKSEQMAFLTIRDAIHWDNQDGEVYITFADTYSQKKFLEGFKLLETKQLVKRTKRSHYMINPHALIPLDYVRGMELWDAV